MAAAACGRRSARWQTTAIAPAQSRRPEAGKEANRPGSSRSPRRLRGLRVAFHHFVLEHAPDLAMQRVKILLHAHFPDIARPRKCYPPVADDARGRPRRDDHDKVDRW